MKVYAVLLNSDTTCGNGPMYLKYVCDDKVQAERLALYHEPYAKANQFHQVKEFLVMEERDVDKLIAPSIELNQLEKSETVKRYLRLKKEVEKTR